MAKKTLSSLITNSKNIFISYVIYYNLIMNMIVVILRDVEF